VAPAGDAHGTGAHMRRRAEHPDVRQDPVARHARRDDPLLRAAA
jgi:hypothetical protein